MCILFDNNGGEKVEKIRVVIIEPGKAPREAHIMPTPEEVQKIIGGYVEQFTIAEDMLALCNGEGWLRTQKPCCNICGVDFAGTVILCGKRRATYSDIPVSLEELRELIPSLWEHVEKGDNRWAKTNLKLKPCSKS